MSDLDTLNDQNQKSSPEYRIAQHLIAANLQHSEPPTLGQPVQTSNDAALRLQLYLSHHASPPPPPLGEESPEIKQQRVAALHATVEGLLVEGRREEAVDTALESHDWALAIVVASVCGKETYQRVVKAFADSNYPKASGLNLMSLIYSSQAEGSLKHGGRSLAVAGAPQPQTALSPDYIWRRNLASVLNNKVGDWNSLARHIGDRIAQETGVSAGILNDFNYY